MQITTRDGRSVVGLLAADRPGEIEVLHAAGIGTSVTIPKNLIQRRVPAEVSIMPAGLVNELADRGQFLDMVRYLQEIAEHGPTMAERLKPDDPSATAPVDIVDHALTVTDVDQGF